MRFRKIAIVYDWFDKWGGAERVLLTFHEMFPKAVFYTSYYNVDSARWIKDIKIETSFIQKLPTFIKHNRIISLPFYSYAFESFNFKDYDLVISVTSSFAKGIITRPETTHICYLLTPARFLWVLPDIYLNNVFSKLIAQPFMSQLKKWDFVVAQRPDSVISISNTVRQRCKDYYKRDSEVVYPPFDIGYWSQIKNKILNIKNKYQKLKDGEYFLLVSRLEQYKRVDLAIQTFNKLPELNLVIVGKGSRFERSKSIVKQNISFINYVSDEELVSLYIHANALIMPQEEDFGFVSLEAQFFGCPVISYKKGGATETIVDNKTGIFFDKQTVESLKKALERFRTIEYNLKLSTKDLGVKQVERFSKDSFQTKFYKLINSNLKKITRFKIWI